MSQIGAVAWKRLSSMTLMEEVCHKEWALTFEKTKAIPAVLFACLLYVGQYGSFQLFQPAYLLLAVTLPHNDGLLDL